MRMILRRTASALLAVLGAWAVACGAMAQEPSAGRAEIRNSILRIPANANFPIAATTNLGQGKSLLVQFPFELKDVLVANPSHPKRFAGCFH